MRHRPPAQYLSIREASRRSGVAEGTLYRLIWSDLIPHERIGAQVVILDEVAERLRKYRERPAGHITTKEAIALSRLSRARLHVLADEGKIKTMKRKWLNTNLVWIEKESLMEYLRRRDNA